MPKDGFKTVTLSDEIFDKIYKQYDGVREEIKEKGIFSFSGYVTKTLIDHKERDDFNDIKELLVVNNTILLQMFEFMLGGSKESAQDNLLHIKMSMFEFLKELKGVNKSW